MEPDDEQVTLDDLRAAHPGAPGPGDGTAWIAALEEGWRPTQILASARLYGHLVKNHPDTPPKALEKWLQTSLGRPRDQESR